MIDCIEPTVEENKLKEQKINPRKNLKKEISLNV